MKSINLHRKPLSMLCRGMAAGLLATVMGLPFAADAKPAYPGIIQHQQPDGTILPIRLMGDHRAHRVFTADGYLLTDDGNGGYVYATIDEQGKTVASSIMALAPELRSAADNAFLAKIDRKKVSERLTSIDNSRRQEMIESTNRARMARKVNSQGIDLLISDYPSTGSPKGLVILVEYKDVKFTTADPEVYFYNMLNQKGFDTNGGTGSALDFFTENSDGKFTPEFDLLGPVTLPERMKYYGGNNAYGTDSHPEEMVIHAFDILDPEVDFSQYDTNGDGYIDNVYIFYAGRGEADHGGADTVWPHSWEIEAGTQKTLKYDGVILNRYACSNEVDNATRKADGIGTFVHEFSHVMGLPDLYATDYTGSFTPGAWSTMDYGPYNNGGRTPPNYGIYERYSLGWVEPKRFSGQATAEYTLPPITSNEAYLVETSTPKEFFLIEVRDRKGWDTYIPGEGMLVWYIDYNESAWYYNRVNNDPYRQRVNIIEADGRPNEATRKGDSFPGSGNITAFTAETNPAFLSRTGQSVNVEFTDIRRNSDGSVTFTATHDVPVWNAVDTVVNDSDDWTLSNNIVSASAALDIYTPQGIKIAHLSAGDTYQLPAPGIYLFCGNNNTSKVLIK